MNSFLRQPIKVVVTCICTCVLYSSVRTSATKYKSIIMDNFVEASNEFAIKVYKQIASADSNIFFCPICLASALTLLMEGSAGKTEAELYELLEMKRNRLEKDIIREVYGNLSERMRLTDCLSQTANGLFVEGSYGQLSDFTETYQTVYNTEVLLAYFSQNPHQAVWDINEFVRTRTGNRIKRLFDRVELGTEMVVVNAFHFGTSMANASESRNKTRTKRKFYNHGVEDHDLEVPVITGKQQTVKIADWYDFRALELPCSTNSSNVKIWIFLPHKVGHLADVEYGLSTDTFRQLDESFRDLVTDICIPRIKFDYFKDLSKELEHLGLRKAFSSGEADFSKISKIKGLHLSQALHRSTVDISESGLHLRSTKHQDIRRSVRQDSSVTPNYIPPPFIANHPFLFCVLDRVTGIILYMGRLFEF